MFDRLTRSSVLGLSRLEEVKDVLRARGGPKGEEMVVRIGESPTTADRHEARVPDLREDHGWPSFGNAPSETRTLRSDQAREQRESGGRVRKSHQYISPASFGGSDRPHTFAWED